ncbi:MAG: DUF4149 domain-containing protein [Pseudomonadota bacterium]
MLTITALLSIALLFGGMTLFSFTFAAFLFTHLPAPDAGKLLRQAFPYFYLWVIGTSALCAALAFSIDTTTAWLMVAIALSTLPTRQVLMPAINAAQDAGEKSRFNRLHGSSVVITLAHIGLAAYCLVRLA